MFCIQDHHWLLLLTARHWAWSRVLNGASRIEWAQLLVTYQGYGVQYCSAVGRFRDDAFDSIQDQYRKKCDEHHCDHWSKKKQISLLWRHNGRDCVSLHHPRDCLLNRLFRRRSKLRITGLIHRSPVNSLRKWPVTRKMFPFDDVIMWWKIQRNCKNGNVTHLLTRLSWTKPADHNFKSLI